MTFPVMIPVGPWALHPHLVFEGLAYFVGFRLYLARRRHQGDVIADGHRWSVVTASAVGAVMGSRLLYWLEDPTATLRHLHDPAFLIGGKTIVGALLGGWIAVELVKRYLGIRGATGDLFAVPLAVGIGIGRVGCFLTGLADHTHGTPTSLPWGVDLGDGVLRHPTALYESIFALALAGALWRFGKPSRRRGDLFKMFMAAYLAFRLAVDALKPELRIALGLSSIQWACVAALAYYSYWYLWSQAHREAGPPRTDAHRVTTEAA